MGLRGFWADSCGRDLPLGSVIDSPLGAAHTHQSREPAARAVPVEVA